MVGSSACLPKTSSFPRPRALRTSPSRAYAVEDESVALLKKELAASQAKVAERQRQVAQLREQLSSHSASNGHGAPALSVSDELEAAQMENKIFSKTMDTLQQEMTRQRVENEKLRGQVREMSDELSAAQAESNRMAVEVRQHRAANEQIYGEAPVASPEDGGAPSGATGGGEQGGGPGGSDQGRTGESLEDVMSAMQLGHADVEKLRRIQDRTNLAEVSTEQLQEAFNRFAMAGTLDRDSFMRAIDSLGVIPNSHRFLFEKFYTLFDRDKNGSVDFSEFTCGLSILCKGDPEAKLQLIFLMMDADGSGLISAPELQTFFMTLFAVTKGVKDGVMLTPQELATLERQTHHEIGAILKVVDTNSDGQLSWDEFHQGVLDQSSKLADVLDVFMILGEKPGAPSPASKRRSSNVDEDELVEIDDQSKCGTQ